MVNIENTKGSKRLTRRNNYSALIKINSQNLKHITKKETCRNPWNCKKVAMDDGNENGFGKMNLVGEIEEIGEENWIIEKSLERRLAWIFKLIDRV